VTAPFAPRVSYSNIVERLRRAFGLVGDVMVEPRPDLTNVVNVADLTMPGHATYRGRRFMQWSTLTAAAANSYMGFKAADIVVITSLVTTCSVAGNVAFSILPSGLADGAGWNWGTQVPFVERVLSVNDWAPVLRMNAFVAAPPAVQGIPLGTAAFAASQATFNEVLRGPIVLSPGDRLMLTNVAVGPVVTLGMAGYVF